MSEIASTQTNRQPDQIGGAVSGAFARLVDVSAARVFAEPVRVGDRVVIPAAAIDLTGGYGFGGGSDNSQEEGGLPRYSGGGGGGGGGRSEGRPVAIVEVGPDGVRVKPVLDFTRIGLTLIAAGLTVWRATARGGRPAR